MLAQPLEGGKPTRGLQMRDNVPEQAEEVLRRHRIEQGADVAVGGDLLDAEQGLAVRAAVPLGELALVGQEGGAL